MAKAGEVRVDITGNADKLGEQAKRAQKYISDLKDAAKSKGLDLLTGGVYTGGAMALVERTLEAVKQSIAGLREIISRAERLNVKPGEFRMLAEVGALAGMDQAQMEGSVQTLRRQRSDALAGDDQAIEAFETLGITIEAIAAKKPDELFYRVLDATNGMELNAERFYRIQQLIGAEAANALLPFTTRPGGWRALRTTAQGGIAADTVAEFGVPVLSSAMRWMQAQFGVDPKDATRAALRAFRQPFEPFSAFGIGNKEQAEFAAEQNRQRLNTVARSQLTTEERINEVIAERLRIMRLIEDEADPVKRQKFISDAIAVEAELAALAMRKDSGAGATRFTGTRDPMREIGAGFSMFASAQATNLAQQQVVETQNVRRSIETGLARLADILADPGGPP